MTQLFTNNAKTTLALAASINDTQLVLTDGSNFASPSGGDFQEVTIFVPLSSPIIVKCIGKTGDVLMLESPLTVDIPIDTEVKGTLTAETADRFRTQIKGVTPEITANYTLVLKDSGKFIPVNSITDVTITIPENSSVAFEIGTVIFFFQKGSGKVICSTTGSTALYSTQTVKSFGQYAVISLVKIATDEWVLMGERGLT